MPLVWPNLCLCLQGDLDENLPWMICRIRMRMPWGKMDKGPYMSFGNGISWNSSISYYIYLCMHTYMHTCIVLFTSIYIPDLFCWVFDLPFYVQHMGALFGFHWYFTMEISNRRFKRWRPMEVRRVTCQWMTSPTFWRFMASEWCVFGRVFKNMSLNALGVGGVTWCCWFLLFVRKNDLWHVFVFEDIQSLICRNTFHFKLISCSLQTTIL